MNEELSAFRDEVRAGFAEVRQKFADVQQEFVAVHRHLDSLDERVQAVDERVQALDGRVQAVDERGRRDGVLLEDLRDDVHQLAEAHVLLDQRVERYRQENEAAHTEILVLLRTSYRDLDRRVTRLEERHPDH